MSVSGTASFVCFVKKIKKRMHKKQLEVKVKKERTIERKQYSKKRSLMKGKREWRKPKKIRK